VDSVAPSDLTTRLSAFFSERPSVRFAYLFGSTARGNTGPMSDIDVAVFLADEVDSFKEKLLLLERLMSHLKTEAVDLVVLNDAPITLKHAVIKDGIVVKEDRPTRITFEADTLREYLDTAYLRDTYNRIVRARMKAGAYSG